MISGGEVFKRDVIGRVQTPRSRQEELLDEFEHSSLSGAKFAALAGIKYQTFAAWSLRRRKQRQGSGVKPSGKKADPVRWLEAVVDQALPPSPATGLIVHLPGGARMEVGQGAQVALAAQLLKLLQKEQTGAC